jgi:hypothetical protein
MSVREPHNRSRSNGQAVTFLSGSVLRRLLHGKPPQERARVAAAIVNHGVAVTELSPAQVARLVDVGPAYLTDALGHRGSRGPHNKTINHLLKHYGPDVLMRALDRVTAPRVVAAE